MIDIPNDDKKEEKKEENIDEKKIEEVLKTADKEDLDLMRKIGNLYNVITNPRYVDFDSLKNAVDSLSEFNKMQEYDYLHNLLVKMQRS